ncbi:MAG: cell division protein FtsZ [Trueperella sp.]|uniref:cell division protein FtsZ n=1 Tax=Trueperella sp. TaxID=2699835 RepID=UPI0025FBF420|nr:cell division protein FtsZ [Trueperella sp.]MCI7305623.1 cell division protein FtsZ [Trueperella sp.]MDY5403024.1 cell division protein FtsZ [Trueperella sp.]
MYALNNSASIKVVGVGGGGVNAVDRMIQDGLAGVDFIAVNTDSQSLAKSEAETKIDIGRDVSNGLGAGADPTVGKRAAEENLDVVVSTLEGADMVFVTAGEGGGTGTGAAPVIARAAREQGALTVGVVTRPFSFEGLQRSRNANDGIRELRDAVDTLIVIPNDRLLEVTEEDLSIIEAYRLADEVLQNGVKGISDLITMPGVVNVDFADVKTIMKDAGTAIMGIGTANGPDRALRATENAISSPLLEARIDGAHGVLLAFTSSTDLGLREQSEAAQMVKEAVDPNANIIIGIIVDESLGDDVRVTVIAAGFDETDDVLRDPAAPVQQAAPTVPATPVVPAVPTDERTPGQAHQQEQPVPTAHRPAVSGTPLEVPVIDEPKRQRPDLDIPPFLFGDE